MVEVLKKLFTKKQKKVSVKKIGNVLSLFDGMSCGQIALNKLGIEYEGFYSSEIDKHAIKVAQHNFPNTIQISIKCKQKKIVYRYRDWETDRKSTRLNSSHRL